MADSDFVVYPGVRPRSTPDVILLYIAATLLYMFFAVVPGFMIAGSVRAPDDGIAGFGVVVGCLFEAALVKIVWTNLHDAAWLEYSGNRLSWRGSLPWAPRMRGGRVRSVRWPVRKSTRRGRYLEIVLTGGRKIAVDPGYGLMEFISAVQQRDPTVRVEIEPGSWWMLPRPDSGLDWLAREAAGNRVLQPVRRVLQVMGKVVEALYTLAFALAILGFLTLVVLTKVGAQVNFGTLRSYIVKVHLPHGYHLAAQRQRGSDCRHNTCSITQTWVWASPTPRTTSSSCADARHAMSRVFPFADPNSPLPSGEACDYFAIQNSFRHPGQGKLEIHAIVTPTKSGRIAITLVAEYP